MHFDKNPQTFLVRFRVRLREGLLAEQVPIIQVLHIHQEVIDQCEIGHADHGRDQDIENRLPHVQLLLNSTKDVKVNSRSVALRISRGTECRRTNRKTRDRWHR